LIIVVVVAVAAAYVGMRVRRELVAARSVLDGSAAELSGASIGTADAHLEEALSELNGPAGKLLRLVPVARQNVLALEALARDTRPVLGAAGEFEGAVDGIEDDGLLDAGRIDLALLERLEAPLEEQVAGLEALEKSARANRTGWLAPLLWDEVDSLLFRASELHTGAENAYGLIRAAGGILGGDGPRTYLIVLLNNAELRGAGGIPSGIGTVTIRDGVLHLGHFDYAAELRGSRPYARVPAPADFRRRYGHVWADRTFWVNTTISSDIPDVAEVAASLYEEIPGQRTDGVLFADPHGVAALMSADAQIAVPGSEATLGPGDLADYAYSTVYEQEESGAVADRHDALLKLGELAFREILTSGVRSRDQLLSVAAAFDAGHLRFVSFEPSERAALQAAGATGDIRPPDGDSVFVTAYNTGADKMDYWARRAVEHNCIVESGESAECSTTVTLRNVAPDGLPRIVSGRPYGVLTNFLEAYVPKDADIEFVERDGEGVEYFEDRQDGHATVGFNLRLGQKQQTTVEVGYRLPLEGAYSLEVLPQPLARDARLELNIELPDGWEVRGPDGVAAADLSYSGRLVGSMSIHAAPRSRTGLSGLWDGLVRFWSEPIG
jgi:hypothetical protein